MKKKNVYGQRWLFVVACVSGFNAWAQIEFDGTTGSTGALSGSSIQVSADQGTASGSNLFHSFSRFNVNIGQDVTFSGNSGINNIIARVTGNDASNINGGLNADTNLFLLNPNGVIFGQNASLDVAGTFYVSTADYLSFEDGTEFYADVAEGLSLTMAAPEAFGFLVGAPSDGAIALQGAELGATGVNSISLIGRSITIDDSVLSAESGQLGVVATESGEVAVRSDDQGGSAPDGEILIDNSAIFSSAPIDGDMGPGDIFLVGGELRVTNGAKVQQLNRTEHQGGVIVLSSDSVEVSDLGMVLSTTYGEGEGGNIAIGAQTISVTGGSIAAETYGDGSGGAIFIDTSTLDVDASWHGFSSITTRAQGQAGLSIGEVGQMLIDAESINLSGGASIYSNTQNNSQAGDIAINSNAMTLDGAQSEMVANTQYRVSRDGEVIIGEENQQKQTELYTNTRGAGEGGNLRLGVDELDMDNQAIIYVASRGIGSSGEINIQSDRINLANQSVIDASTEWAADGGTITINTGTISLTQGSQIRAESTGYGFAGDAGSIFINATSMDLLDDSKIITSATSASGGNITIQLDDSLFMRDAEISTSVSSNEGNGGNIFIDPEIMWLIDSRIIARAVNGRGGDIVIEASEILGTPGSVIDASSELGVDGVVNSSPLIEIETEVVVDEGVTLTPDIWEKDPCAGRGSSNVSRLVVQGADGAQVSPGDLRAGSSSELRRATQNASSSMQVSDQTYSELNLSSEEDTSSFGCIKG